MATVTDNTVSTLNGLINSNKNAAKGYRTASENVADASLKQVFEKHIARRNRFAEDLQAWVRRYGGDPETTGSTPGAMFRAWMNFRGALSGGDPLTMLAECERGEDQAVDDYETALRENSLHPDARSLIERQFVDVKAAHDQMKALRDAG